jgi:cytochrome c oxidase cbb3-type subunit 3
MRLLLLFTLTAGLLPAADAPNPDAAKRGALKFKSACGFCHGDDATGSRAPDLIRSAILSHDVDGELLGPMIREGRPDKGMPGFPLPKDQMADVVAFLHAQAKAALNSNRVGRDYPLEKLLTGNAEAGKAYFNGAGRCHSCHSPTGDLSGIGKKFSPIDLQSRFLYPNGSKSTVTVTTSDGKQFTGTLLHIDTFDIAMKDRDGWYHSWPRSQVKAEVHDPLEAHRQLLGQYTEDNVHNLFAYLESLQ